MEFISAAIVAIGISVILASSFNLILGYGGLISIAHPIFFAIGAYTSAIVSMEFGVPIPISAIAGMVVAALSSIVLALPSLRVSGDYLVISSMGFQLGMLQVIKNAEFTGGAGGLSNIPPLLPSYSAGNMAIYWAIIWSVAALCIFVVSVIVRGHYGRAITAMRDDEQAFVSVGRNPTRIKVALFAIGSAFAGLAGALYAHYVQFLAPEQFDIAMSGALLTMVIVGGVRTVIGPLAGAVMLECVPRLINLLELPNSIIGPLQGMIYTALVLAFLFFKPQGFIDQKRQDWILSLFFARKVTK